MEQALHVADRMNFLARRRHVRVLRGPAAEKIVDAPKQDLAPRLLVERLRVLLLCHGRRDDLRLAPADLQRRVLRVEFDRRVVLELHRLVVWEVSEIAEIGQRRLRRQRFVQPHLEVGMRRRVPLQQLCGDLGGRRLDDEERLRGDPAWEGHDRPARLEDRAVGHRIEVDVMERGEGQVAVEIGPHRRAKSEGREDQEAASNFREEEGGVHERAWK